MRVAIFVAVVAAHVIVFLLFPVSWRRASQEKEDEPSLVPIALPPLTDEAVAPQLLVPSQSRVDPWQAPLLYRGERGFTADSAGPRKRQAQRHRETQSAQPEVAGSQPAEPQAAVSQPPVEPAQPTPDWRAQAAETAQLSAQHIVEAEEIAKRQANALTAHIKPLAPDRVRGPGFGWGYASTHRISPMPGGGFVYAFSDHCQLMIFPMPFIGCRIGKTKANGDLFKYLHPPVKFGAWDKRDQDP